MPDFHNRTYHSDLAAGQWSVRYFFGAVLVFQLVTLPTEINASRRAMKTLESMYLLEGDELTGARKTLTAAAMTYVAADCVNGSFNF